MPFTTHPSPMAAWCPPVYRRPDEGSGEIPQTPSTTQGGDHATREERRRRTRWTRRCIQRWRFCERPHGLMPTAQCRSPVSCIGLAGPLREPEPVGRRAHAQALVRPLGVVVHDPAVEGGLQLGDGGDSRSCRRKNPARIVLCSRSTLPFVVGEYGAVSKCGIPFSAQIRSKRTVPGPSPNRAVNTLPLSV